ncbi:hypothetical protein AS188_13025 [Kocuria flava]|uniref:Integral membrane protein n=1 Tax=Kocuria flava TaxID=446860 RepID=A0A0U3IAT2_9MICC|nr:MULTISPECIES: hypothetical protein [Kocuria]ALU40524.1 hypothetical protein AS188_13025 [Kocuria flava]MCD1145730.1 hypothetical protein [Kocuria sp. LUK]PLC12436.1 hypothetical protein AUQ48_09605 [Kocuria flava]
MTPTAAPTPPGPRPRAVTVLAAVVLLEALALALAGARLLWSLVAEEPLTVGGTVFLLVVALAGALWLHRVARGLWRGYRWPRAAALVVQLFLLVLGVPLLQGGQWAAGLALALPAAVVLLLLFRPAVLAWTSRTVR